VDNFECSCGRVQAGIPLEKVLSAMDVIGLLNLTVALAQKDTRAVLQSVVLFVAGALVDLYTQLNFWQKLYLSVIIGGDIGIYVGGGVLSSSVADALASAKIAWELISNVAGFAFFAYSTYQEWEAYAAG
jgi:hypothetical protein